MTKLKVVSGLTTVLALSLSLDSEAQKKIWKDGDGKPVVTGIDPEVYKLNQAFTVLAERLSTSVVSIATRTQVRNPHMGSQEDLFRFFFGNPFGDPRMQPRGREAQSMGSGFVLNDEGYVITNSHVIRQGGRNADKIFAKFLGDAPSFEGWEAEVVGVDETSDVAVLKLKSMPKNISPVVLGESSKIKVGEWVMAIGNPLGHSHSVTSGIVSALGRSIDLETRTDFIQTDASINPGNSGGPLFNLRGEVIGINTAVDARAQGIGFAIPMDTAKGVIRQLVEKGSVDLGWIGVAMADVNPAIAEQLGLKQKTGVLIQDVIPGEPAEKAGLKSYDVVVGVNGNVVHTSRDMMRHVANLSVGERARLEIFRDGKKQQVDVQVGRRKSQEELAKQEERRIDERSEKGRGMLLSELTADQKAALGIKSGVLVQGVAPESFAARAGVRSGDILLEVNRKGVSGVSQAEKALNEKRKAYLLKLQRQQATLIILMET